MITSHMNVHTTPLNKKKTNKEGNKINILPCKKNWLMKFPLDRWSTSGVYKTLTCWKSYTAKNSLKVAGGGLKVGIT